MMNKKITMITISAFVGLVSVPLYSCVITIINDSSDKILIRDIHDGSKATQFVLPKGKMRRFGNPHKLANFEVYTKKTKGPLYDLAYECRQNECGVNKNPHIKFSDLSSNSEAIALFTVINHQESVNGQGQKPGGCCNH